MNPLYGSLWNDLGWASVLGMVGGFAFGLLQEKGLAFPNLSADNGTTFLNLGFIADILVGALAAVITYGVSQPSQQLSMILASLTAGIGGRAILKGYINGQVAGTHAQISDQSLRLAADAITTAANIQTSAQGGVGAVADMASETDVPNLRGRLEELQAARAQVKRRWGIR
jgi:hypothetical protein